MEEITVAKRWVDEQKRIAFARSSSHFVQVPAFIEFFFLAPDSNGIVSHSPVPESDVPEYRRNLERLDEALCKIEKYIHVAFTILKKEEVVQRMFTMVSVVCMVRARITTNRYWIRVDGLCEISAGRA